MKLNGGFFSLLIFLSIFSRTYEQQQDSRPINAGDGKRVLKHGITLGKSFNKDVKKVVRDIRGLQREYLKTPNHKTYYVPVRLADSKNGNKPSDKPIYIGLNAAPTSDTANKPPNEQSFSAYLYVTEIYDSKSVDGGSGGKEFNIDLKSNLYKVDTENAVKYPNILPQFNPKESLNYDATMKGLKDPRQSENTIVRLALTVVESVRFKNVREAVHQSVGHDSKNQNVNFHGFAENIRDWSKGGDNVKVLNMNQFKQTPNNYNRC